MKVLCKGNDALHAGLPFPVIPVIQRLRGELRLFCKVVARLSVLRKHGAEALGKGWCGAVGHVRLRMGQTKQIVEGAGKQIGDRERTLKCGKLFLAQIAVDHGEIRADRLGERLGRHVRVKHQLGQRFAKIRQNICVRGSGFHGQPSRPNNSSSEQ